MSAGTKGLREDSGRSVAVIEHHEGRNAEDPQINKAGYFLAAGGAALLALACFLPWITASAPFIGTISRNGMDNGGDGVWLLVGAVAVFAIAMWGAFTGRENAASIGWIYMALGVITFVVGVLEKNDVTDRIATATSASSLIVASTGTGIWLIFVAGALVAVGGFLLIRKTDVPVRPDR